jgi:phage replication-related protein YjqB (UPF0714/DUF867 family)
VGGSAPRPTADAEVGPSAFAGLLGHPGVQESCELRSRFGFMAFHGGNLERVTDTIAHAAADAAGASVYSVRQPTDLRWHVPSTAIDPAHSPALAAFLDHVEVVVALHGYGRRGLWSSLLLGGRHRRLAGHLAVHLRPSLDGYELVDDLEAIPRELRGIHPRNPVNRCRGGGVQVELPPRVRGMGPRWVGHPPDRPVPHTMALIDGLAAAASDWDC